MKTFHIYYNSKHIHTMQAVDTNDALYRFNREYPFYNAIMLTTMEVYVP